MGCQKQIAKKIIDGGGDYVLAVKDNQPKLRAALQEHFHDLHENDFVEGECRRHRTREKGHGREEERYYYQTPLPESMRAFAGAWSGLATIGQVISVIRTGGEEVSDVRYFISSLAPGVKCFASAVRGHWGIENSLHWVLDMTFKRHVQYPVQTVFDSPVPSHRAGETLDARRQAADEVSHVGNFFAAGPDNRNHLSDRRQTRPRAGKGAHRLGQRRLIVVTFLLAAMTLLARPVTPALAFDEIVLMQVVKVFLQGRAQLGLVILDRQHVVAAAVDDFLRDLFLTAHRIDRHNRPVQPR